MINVIFIVIVALAAVCIFAATKPNAFSVVRRIRVVAAPEAVFAEINDFNRWKFWSPWEAKDPNMTRNFSGAALGVGTVYEWSGNKEVGHGRMEITASIEPHTIIIKLDFIKPFEAHNTAEFTISPTADDTEIKWEMRGRQAFMMKLFGMFMNMDKMIGKDFEAGLLNLKTLVEKR